MEKIWLKSYPKGVPAEINLDEFMSLVDLFDKTCEKISLAVSRKKSFRSLLTCKPMSPVFKGLRERNAVSN